MRDDPSKLRYTGRSGPDLGDPSCSRGLSYNFIEQAFHREVCFVEGSHFVPYVAGKAAATDSIDLRIDAASDADVEQPTGQLNRTALRPPIGDDSIQDALLLCWLWSAKTACDENFGPRNIVTVSLFRPD